MKIEELRAKQIEIWCKARLEALFKNSDRPLRFNVVEYVCSHSDIDPIEMGRMLIRDGVDIVFDDGSIRLERNRSKARKVYGKEYTMTVHSIKDRIVFITRSDGRDLFDFIGNKWKRNSDRDVCNLGKNSLAAYTKYADDGMQEEDTVLLTVGDIQRIIAAKGGTITQDSVEELREYAKALPSDIQEIVDGWSDYKLQQCINNSNSFSTAVDLMTNEALEYKHSVDSNDNAEIVQKDTKTVLETHSASKVGRSIPTKKTQEKAILVQAEGCVPVTLTKKQAMFMSNLERMDGWKIHGTMGEYPVNLYVEDLSDLVSPSAMGAMITTLRQKGLITTRKDRVHGILCCLFRLTEKGAAVYHQMKKEGVNNGS